MFEFYNTIRVYFVSGCRELLEIVRSVVPAIDWHNYSCADDDTIVSIGLSLDEMIITSKCTAGQDILSVTELAIDFAMSLKIP